VEEAPSRGYIPPVRQMVAFRALPISSATLRGLEESSSSSSMNHGAAYTTMTDIQNACIPHALAGRDVLGAVRHVVGS
jgi:ATP-dependent RNA helicase DDX10/DBP4